MTAVEASAFIACSVQYLTATFVAGLAFGFAFGLVLSAAIIWMEKGR